MCCGCNNMVKPHCAAVNCTCTVVLGQPQCVSGSAVPSLMGSGKLGDGGENISGLQPSHEKICCDALVKVIPRASY